SWWARRRERGWGWAASWDFTRAGCNADPYKAPAPECVCRRGTGMSGGKTSGCWILRDLFQVASLPPGGPYAGPPIPPPRDVHDRRHQHHADQGRVEEHGKGQSEADELHGEHAGAREIPEHDATQQCGERNCGRRGRQAFHGRVIVATGLVEDLLHA